MKTISYSLAGTHDYAAGITPAPDIQDKVQENVGETRIIVAGGRDFADYPLLSDSLLSSGLIQPGIVIVSGGAKGADVLGERFAREHGLSVRQFPANWEKYGKAAGPIRNKEMAEFAGERNGVLFAFWDGQSRGTASMIRLARECGLDVHVVKY